MQQKKSVLVIVSLFIALFAAPFVFSQEWTYDSNSINMNVRMTGSYDIISSEVVKYVRANVSYLPRTDERQTVTERTYQPSAQEFPAYVEFEWNNPPLGKQEFYINTKITGMNQLPEVRSKIPFPYQNIPEEYLIYTKPTDLIDSDNPQVVNMASQLAAGDDDYYVVVFKMAEWVERNITYSLNTLTADASQKSSWVLTNRIGVCDELTNLFIGMARSLGIPARFASGVAYTDYNNLSDWGPHAWAEVYFPDYGWVPFDIAYSQFGFIDPTHVKLKDSLDSSDPSVSFAWLGRDVTVEPSKMNVKVNLINYEGKEPQKIALKTRFVYPEAGFGSYNLLEVEAENLNDYYMSTFVYVSEVSGTQLIGDFKKHIMLKPMEKKKYYWIIKVDENLSTLYEYTFPFVAYSFGETKFENQFKSNIKKTVHSYKEISEIMGEKTEEAEKSYSANIEFSCSAVNADDKDRYVNDAVDITCKIKNAGNQFINSIAICPSSSQSECKYESLGITQEKIVSFTKTIASAGANEFKIKASNDLLSKTASISLFAKDYPKVEILEINAPPNVKYKENFDIIVKLKKYSSTGSKNTSLRIIYNDIEKEFNIGDMENDFEVNLLENSFNLNEDNNEIKAVLSYEDARSNKYSGEKSVIVNLEKLSLWQKVDRFFRRIFS